MSLLGSWGPQPLCLLSASSSLLRFVLCAGSRVLFAGGGGIVNSTSLYAVSQEADISSDRFQRGSGLSTLPRPPALPRAPPEVQRPGEGGREGRAKAQAGLLSGEAPTWGLDGCASPGRPAGSRAQSLLWVLSTDESYLLRLYPSLQSKTPAPSQSTPTGLHASRAGSLLGHQGRQLRSLWGSQEEEAFGPFRDLAPERMRWSLPSPL